MVEFAIFVDGFGIYWTVIHMFIVFAAFIAGIRVRGRLLAFFEGQFYQLLHAQVGSVFVDHVAHSLASRRSGISQGHQRHRRLFGNADISDGFNSQKPGAATPFENCGMMSGGTAWTSRAYARYEGEGATLGSVLVTPGKVPDEFVLDPVSVTREKGWVYLKGGKTQIGSKVKTIEEMLETYDVTEVEVEGGLPGMDQHKPPPQPKYLTVQERRNKESGYIRPIRTRRR